MNLLLFYPEELTNRNQLTISGRRANHLHSVLKVEPSDSIRCGMINGKIGTGIVEGATKDGFILSWQPEQPSPPPLPCTLVLALPRPKMMRRIIQHAVAMGVKNIHLINSWKVDKSYWHTPWLERDALHEQYLLGLEQSVDTVLPTVHIHKLFKPFVEDVLPLLTKNQLSIVAHPRSFEQCPVDIKQPSLITIGPEGGFTDYEIQLMLSAGLRAVSIGERILRVETALPVLLSRLHPA